MALVFSIVFKKKNKTPTLGGGFHIITERYELGVTLHRVQFPCINLHESIQMDTFVRSTGVDGSFNFG